MYKQARIFVRGDVTKVGFRGWMQLLAKQLQLNGWIQNVYDKPDIYGPQGGVEILIQGDENRINDMVDHVQEGSPISHIENVDVQYEEPTEKFDSFELRKSKSFNPHL